jgi:KipI family sensor histidine kinase inhibitor
MYDTLKFLLAGDRHLVVEVGDTISREVHAKVQALYSTIHDAMILGVEELVPTYRSVSVYYNPSVIRQDDLKLKINDLVIAPTGSTRGRNFGVPVLYGGDYGPDLEFVAAYNNLPIKEVISIHTQNDYLVHMMGFAPGFAYLGGVSERITAPRLETPRIVIPAGSVGIADAQTGVYPQDSPGGWQLIGRTPLKFFNPHRDPPVFLDAGDYIHFHAIEQEEYIQIEELVAAGLYEVDSHYA